ncbi:Glycosyl hydrolases family 35 [Paenibacillus sp. UNC496MF]|uniref:beta-galactosidase n=1 Tax=Paenibacillus sp. UNC496MF TaxID=1502753 RepID=UPI0008EAAE80|nr:beta-galactosidase [Paenibacillus sp. UNC496MF]SFJ51422.1 Glycosyl hydrolases family 35 [Paenibacillus sp. UNC496MF]
MNMDTTHDTALQLGASSLRIGGQAEIVLCASLFYFRLPRALWRERMEQVKACGYNAIDVYFPWNYHELEEGRWDFAGERDAEFFLRQAVEAGLWVVARPGPYICSEWDGGGLPAYLFAKPGMVIRSAEPAYMEAVKRWYDRILPLLAKYEANRGGTVLCVQLENELDFYDCPDPAAYIAALRDLALAGGITVPLIACAGQGGLREASGTVDGVVPTCNFYPNDRDPAFEDKAASYERRLAELNLPLLVTETNRSHFLLRRLLSCGAKLLGPYLQASGTNFGFTNGTNNWGDPLAFMTSDYDFRGMISPEGHLRPEALEGLLLRRVIRTYGDAIAEAASAPAAETAGLERNAGEPAGGALLERTLRLAGGGELLFLANVGGEAEAVALRLADAAGGARSIPRASRLQSVPMRCAMLPAGVPLARWGVPAGTLRYATAELSDAHRAADRTVLVFHAEHEGEIALALGEAAPDEAANGVAADADSAMARANGPAANAAHAADALAAEAAATASRMTVQALDGELVFHYKAVPGQIASATLVLAGGRRLTLIGLAREDALLLAGIGDDGGLSFRPPADYDDAPRELRVGWTRGDAAPAQPLAAEPAVPLPAAEPLEAHGVYRGFAWYRAASGLPEGKRAQGLLLRHGADVVSLYAGADYVGTVAPGGGSRYLPASESMTIGAGESLTARVEIWGHTNFDDPRLPGLRLNSLKGLAGLTAVTAKRRLTSNWRVRRMRDRALLPELLGPDCDDAAWPIVAFGGWLSPDHPAFEYYRRRFVADGTADAFTLCFQGIQAIARVFVNGAAAGQVHPFDPYVDISAFVRPGEDNLIAVFLERVLGLPAGDVILYEGNASREWTLSACEEAGLLEHAERLAAGAAAAELPVELAPGGVAWLYGTLPEEAGGVPGGWRARAEGSGLKLTAFLGDTIVGRLWTAGGASSSRPVFSGGDQASFYLPGPWLLEREDGARLTLLLEAVETGEPGRLERLTFVPVGEPKKRTEEDKQ